MFSYAVNVAVERRDNNPTLAATNCPAVSALKTITGTPAAMYSKSLFGIARCSKVIALAPTMPMNTLTV